MAVVCTQMSMVQVDGNQQMLIRCNKNDDDRGVFRRVNAFAFDPLKQLSERKFQFQSDALKELLPKCLAKDVGRRLDSEEVDKQLKKILAKAD